MSRFAIKEGASREPTRKQTFSSGFETLGEHAVEHRGASRRSEATMPHLTPGMGRDRHILRSSGRCNSTMSFAFDAARRMRLQRQ